MWLWESNLTTFGEVSSSNNEFKEIPPVAFGGTIESHFSDISFSGQTNFINNTITNELGYGAAIFSFRTVLHFFGAANFTGNKIVHDGDGAAI